VSAAGVPRSVLAGPLALAPVTVALGVLGFWFGPLLAGSDESARFALSLVVSVFLLPLLLTPPGARLSSQLRVEGDQLVATGLDEVRARVGDIVSVTSERSVWLGASRLHRVSVYVRGRSTPVRCDGSHDDVDAFLRALAAAPGSPRTFQTVPADLRSLLWEVPAVAFLAAIALAASTLLHCVYPAQFCIGVAALLGWTVSARLRACVAPFRAFRFCEGAWLSRQSPGEPAPREYRPWMDAVALGGLKVRA
jgi:hypothetical protein